MRQTSCGTRSAMVRAARQFVCLVFLTLAVEASAQTATDLNEGFRLVHDDTTGVFTLSWWGKAGRSYFVQTSTDLMEWTYLPMVESGSDDVSGIQFTNAEPRQFWRLRYTDAATGGNAETADFDGDKVSNLLEAQNNTDPFSNEDSDGDGIPNDWEVAVGMNSSDPYDSLLDIDGDRIPNIYEYVRGTLANNATSKPVPDVLVDSSQTVSSNVKTTISAAQTRLNQLGVSYGIIRVNPGLTGSYPENIFLDDGPVLLLADHGSLNPAVAGGTPTIKSVSIYSPNCALDGFIITRVPFSTTSEYAVLLDTSNDLHQGRLVNCLVTGNEVDDGTGGIMVYQGRATVAHCTIFGNRRRNIGDNSVLGVQVYSAGHLDLQNSIVWNDDGYTGGRQVVVRSGGSITVTNSIIMGGAFGGIDVNPQLDSMGRLMAYSPARDPSSSVVLPVSTKDIHGESRDSTPDIGVDEFFDSDTDQLPDWWEQSIFTNLAQSGNGDHDSDGLSNFGEYMAGLNPLVADSDGDGVGDLAEAVAMAATAYYYAGDAALDADGDGLSLAQEQLIGSDPNVADSNGDGLPDGAAWSMGGSVTGNDPDGDGVSTANELAQGTSPVMADTDGDGVNDMLDAFPLDPNATGLTGGDATAPVVLLTKPADATLIP